MNEFIVTKRVVAGVWAKNDSVLVEQRNPGQRYAGQWLFPGGKVESGETLHEALKRELKEELGVTAAVGGIAFHSTSSVIGLTRYEVHYFLVDAGSQKPKPLVGQHIEWILRSDLQGLNWALSNKEAVVELVERKYLS